jgi:hypothetical protein
MEDSLSWERNCSLTSQEVPLLICKPQVYTVFTRTSTGPDSKRDEISLTILMLGKI